jgi:vitamin B12 transporter
MPALPPNIDQSVITASRAPQPEAQTPASVSVIEKKNIERLGEPLVSAYLRLTPSASVSTSGPQGSLTEVRIRGAEANHTLLFIDGIKVNDPAADDSARFELLNADIASRIEVVRGPQSALWGSEAIGGVIAVNGVDDPGGASASLEGGSFGFGRASGAFGVNSGGLDLAGGVGWQRATGIDSFGSPGGDKDGYRNLSGRARATIDVGRSVRVGAAFVAFTARNRFDGYDLTTFVHEDTLDSSRNRLTAGRIWAEVERPSEAWSGRIGLSLLGSAQHNYLAAEPINRTRGTRRTVDAQVQHRFATGGLTNEVIVAGETEHETFSARDVIYGGLTDQDRNRSHQAVTVEWRASTPALTGDIAVRRDLFNRFKDATSLRASVLANVGGGFAVTASYANGIAQPTFIDLYGYFPGNFVGNPRLRPESSGGFETAVRFRRNSLEASITAFEQSLHDEIVLVGDPVTFLLTADNSRETSHRYGIEAQGAWHVADRLRLSASYTYLHATEPDSVSGRQVTEHRRPPHSGSFSADGSIGRWSYGASIAYVGLHLDSRDNYPYDTVRLGS